MTAFSTFSASINAMTADLDSRFRISVGMTAESIFGTCTYAAAAGRRSSLGAGTSKAWNMLAKRITVFER